MAASKAAIVDDYLAELPPDRRAVVAYVRDLVNRQLPPGYRETMAWGMISWEVPLERSGPTYNKQPLVYAALAAQKSHYALYLNCVYGSAARSERLQAAYRAAGRKLDMGKSCLRFKRLDELVEDAIAAEISAAEVETFLTEAAAAKARA